MNIALIDVDGHNGFPNLALMKLSAYHKNIDGNNQNNSISNLEWVTDEENKAKAKELRDMRKDRANGNEEEAGRREDTVSP